MTYKDFLFLKKKKVLYLQEVADSQLWMWGTLDPVLSLLMNLHPTCLSNLIHIISGCPYRCRKKTNTINNSSLKFEQEKISNEEEGRRERSWLLLCLIDENRCPEIDLPPPKHTWVGFVIQQNPIENYSQAEICGLWVFLCYTSRYHKQPQIPMA